MEYPKFNDTSQLTQTQVSTVPAAHYPRQYLPSGDSPLRLLKFRADPQSPRGNYWSRVMAVEPVKKRSVSLNPHKREIKPTHAKLPTNMYVGPHEKPVLSVNLCGRPQSIGRIFYDVLCARSSYHSYGNYASKNRVRMNPTCPTKK